MTGPMLAGLGPLAPLLADAAVTDVLVAGPGEVWVDRGHGVEPSGVVLASEEEVRGIAVRLAALGGRRLDDAQPAVDVDLGAGVRMHAVLPPVAWPGTAVSLRVRRRRVGLGDWERTGGVAADGARLLRALVAAGETFVVTGATGAGKTSLLEALLGLVPRHQRVVVVEEAKELRPRHPHVVTLQARPPNVEGAGAVPLRDLVRHSLRMRPDRLVLGEARGAEVVDLLAALTAGHAGAATLHAASPAEVPERFEALASLAGIPSDAVGRLVLAGVHAVVHVSRDARAGRCVTEVAVVRPGADGRPRVVPAWRPGGGPDLPAADWSNGLLARSAGAEDPRAVRC